MQSCARANFVEKGRWQRQKNGGGAQMTNESPSITIISHRNKKTAQCHIFLLLAIVTIAAS